MEAHGKVPGALDDLQTCWPDRLEITYAGAGLWRHISRFQPGTAPFDYVLRVPAWDVGYQHG